MFEIQNYFGRDVSGPKFSFRSFSNPPMCGRQRTHATAQAPAFIKCAKFTIETYIYATLALPSSTKTIQAQVFSQLDVNFLRSEEPPVYIQKGFF